MEALLACPVGLTTVESEALDGPRAPEEQSQSSWRWPFQWTGYTGLVCLFVWSATGLVARGVWWVVGAHDLTEQGSLAPLYWSHILLLSALTGFLGGLISISGLLAFAGYFGGSTKPQGWASPVFWTWIVPLALLGSKMLVWQGQHLQHSVMAGGGTVSEGAFSHFFLETCVPLRSYSEVLNNLGNLLICFDQRSYTGLFLGTLSFSAASVLLFKGYPRRIRAFFRLTRMRRLG